MPESVPAIVCMCVFVYRTGRTELSSWEGEASYKSVPFGELGTTSGIVMVGHFASAPRIGSTSSYCIYWEVIHESFHAIVTF